MKAIVLAIFLTLFSTTISYAEEDGWVKVDANGNAVGGVVVCSAAVCGDSNSQYSQLTLQPGERYVLQFKADPVTKNVAGIPAMPGIDLKVDLETNTWSMNNKELKTLVDDPNSLDLVTTTYSWNPLFSEGTQTTISQITIQRILKMENGTVTP